MELALSINKHLQTEEVSKHKFTTQQSRFLLASRTLKIWSGKSLVQRVALFKQRYPYCHCTVYKLRKLYKEHGIKRKMIRMTKSLPIRSQAHALLEAQNLADDVRSAHLQGFRLQFCDEMVVTKTAIPKLNW